jgi:hypothetical protein
LRKPTSLPIQGNGMLASIASTMSLLQKSFSPFDTLGERTFACLRCWISVRGERYRTTNGNSSARGSYACFYAISALLVRDGLSSSKHAGVRSLFNRQYVKTGKIPKIWPQSTTIFLRDDRRVITSTTSTFKNHKFCHGFQRQKNSLGISPAWFREGRVNALVWINQQPLRLQNPLLSKPGSRPLWQHKTMELWNTATPSGAFGEQY